MKRRDWGPLVIGLIAGYLLAAFVLWDFFWIEDIADWPSFGRFFFAYITLVIGALSVFLVRVVRR